MLYYVGVTVCYPERWIAKSFGSIFVKIRQVSVQYKSLPHITIIYIRKLNFYSINRT